MGFRHARRSKLVEVDGYSSFLAERNKDVDPTAALLLLELFRDTTR